MFCHPEAKPKNPVRNGSFALLRMTILVISFFCLCSFLFGDPSASPQDDRGKISCEQYWRREKKLARSEYIYNYEKHAKKTEKGNEGYTEFQKIIDRKNCYKEWSVFVFMNADNNLSPYSYLDLHEMESLGSTTSVDVVVQLDTIQNTGVKRFHLSQDPEVAKNPRAYRQWTLDDVLDFDETRMISPIVEYLPEINSGTKKALRDFLNFAFENYPAKHYAVIVWSHGMGWDAKISEDFKTYPSHLDLSGITTPLPPEEIEKYRENKTHPQGGISFDESTKEGEAHLTIPELRSVLSHVSATYLDSQPIDVYASDACLMQMLEVAYEFKKQVRYIVGSANMEGKMGWPYRSILKALMDAPLGGIQKRDSAENWVRQIPDLYRSSYSGGSTSSQGNDERAIMTVIFAHELKRFFPYVLTELGEALMQYLKEDPLLEGKRYDAVRYLIGQTFVYSGLTQDLYYFSVLLNLMLNRKDLDTLSLAEKKLKDKIIGLQDAMSRVAPFRASSDFYYKPSVFGATRGLAIWLPSSNEEFKDHISRYSVSKLYRMDDFLSKHSSGWGEFNRYIHSKSGFQGLGKLGDVSKKAATHGFF